MAEVIGFCVPTSFGITLRKAFYEIIIFSCPSLSKHIKSIPQTFTGISIMDIIDALGAIMEFIENLPIRKFHISLSKARRVVSDTFAILFLVTTLQLVQLWVSLKQCWIKYSDLCEI